MKLKVLVDNNTYIDRYYLGEPAVSYYIEDGDKKILFDTGYSDIFLKNAKAMNIDLNHIDTIVISHGHDDHTGGLTYYFKQRPDNKVSVIAHPDAFKEKVSEGLKICSPIRQQELREKCGLILSKEPVKISEHITFLGEIPKLTEYERRRPIGVQITGGISEEDYVMDDSALVYQKEEGIFIITGCSHSGICNILEYAKKVSGESRVLGVIGGFHLFEVNERVKQTIDYFKENKIKELYPCHCTSLAVKAEMLKVLPVKEVGVGLEIDC